MITGAELAVVLALIALSKKGKGSVTASTKTAVSAREDGDKLIARANQAPALAWVTAFAAQGEPDAAARALARWAGIESSGNPTEISTLGERGLLQIGEGQYKDGAISTDSWEAYAKPGTSRDEVARISIVYRKWATARAERYVTNPDAGSIDKIWYAKLYHQRPVDVRDGKLHGPAAPMAMELAARWASDQKKMHYLRAANVVAWGTAEPPR